MLRREFEAFCIRNQGGMFKVALQVTKNQQTAEDAVQEAFFRIYRIFSSLEFETERQERVYVLRAAKNAALDMLKKERACAEYCEGVIDFAEYSKDLTLETVLARDFGAAVAALLKKLPEKAKTIYSYRQMGLSDAEIAQTLSISVSDVRTTVFRARKKITECLRKEGGYLEECR